MPGVETYESTKGMENYEQQLKLSIMANNQRTSQKRRGSRSSSIDSKAKQLRTAARLSEIRKAHCRQTDQGNVG